MTAGSRALAWVGTFPGDGPMGESGTGEGIWRVTVTEDALAGDLVAQCPSPGFLALGPEGRTLFATAETMAGGVGCFDVRSDGRLTETQRVGSGGRWPCHLTVHPSGTALYVANFHSGSLGVITLADGRFSPEVLAAGGPVQTFEFPDAVPGPDKREQHGSRLHFSVLSPDGEFLLVCDLGTDELRRFRILEDGRLDAAGIAFTHAPGTGPRHIASGPGGHLYVVGELSGTIDILRWDGGRAVHVDTVVLPRGGASHRAHPAHIVCIDGRVLVSVRGPDVIVEYRIENGGASLSHSSTIDAAGAWPRHFAVLDSAWVVVAAQRSAEVTSQRWDAASGDRVSRLTIPYPACVLEIP